MSDTMEHEQTSVQPQTAPAGHHPARRQWRVWVVLLVLTAMAAALYGLFLSHPADRKPLAIAYPLPDTIFPPDLAPPRVRWTGGPDKATWRITVGFADGTAAISSDSTGRTWQPTAAQWQTMRAHSTTQPARLTITAAGRRAESAGVSFRTSADPVGAPIFYREVILPFSEALIDPSQIRWRYGSISETRQPPIVLDKLPVCGNCHSFSADGRLLGMDVDYANDKGSYTMAPVEPHMVLDPAKIITWGDYDKGSDSPSYGLLSQVSPDGRYAISTVKDRSVFIGITEIEFSSVFFPVQGLLAYYDRQTRAFGSLAGADDPTLVQSNPVWSPDGKTIVFVRTKAYQFRERKDSALVSLEGEELDGFTRGGRTFRYDLYRVPFNGGRGGTPQPIAGASNNGLSNFFPKFSPDGQWLVFCQANSFMLLQPDSKLYIMPADGSDPPRPLECNTRRMNSWHSWSPNSRWLVFSSKVNGPYTQLFLTHIDEQGHASPPVELAWFSDPNRAANVPEFVNASADAIQRICVRLSRDLDATSQPAP